MSLRSANPRQRAPRAANLAVPRPASLGDDSGIAIPRPQMASTQWPRPQSVPLTSTLHNPGTEPALSIGLPTKETLEVVQHCTLDAFSDADKLHWAQDVIRLVDRQLKVTKRTEAPRALHPLLSAAIPIIVSTTAHKSSVLLATASYIKAHLLSTGACPDYIEQNARQAFKDFEIAARAGEIRAWFRLGRDYESCGELGRAKACFERGANKGDCECLYRMGMAHLLGQLELPSSPDLAISMLRRAASLATTDAPQACYVFGMLLAGEFDHVAIPPSLLVPSSSGPSPRLDAQHAEARACILRAAYLCFAPAQYKAGYLYEHASLGCAYDPLLSVQYYSLASQNGEVEADMALSKWFLGGAEGCFDKNEALARTFASKAAKAGLASGCFALGYYYELGIGGEQDVEQARKWYGMAAHGGNKEGSVRLAALSGDGGALHNLSARDHANVLATTLVRARSDAQTRSDRARPGQRRAGEAVQGVEHKRSAAQRLAHRASMARRGSGEEVGAQAFPEPQPQPPPQTQPRPNPMPELAQLDLVGAAADAVDGRATPRPGMPRRGAINGGDPRERARHSGHSGSTSSAASSLRQAYTLHDPALIDGPSEGADGARTLRPPRQKRDVGAATFEEMGFVSKPVKDEECVVM